MKKKQLINVILLLLSGLILSCEKETAEKYEYVYNNDYIRDTIMYHIKLGTIGNKHKFLVNDTYLESWEINTIISSIHKDNIISVRIIDKKTAVDAYKSEATDGIVRINHYIDPLLKPHYYNISNVYLTDVLEDLIAKGVVVRYPLILLNEVPLRGPDIAKVLNNLNNNMISGIYYMSAKSGLLIFGERAINGVVLIYTDGTKIDTKLKSMTKSYN